MDKQKKHSLMSFGRHLTSTVSVALVLLILGIVGSLAVVTRNVTDSIKENLGFNITLNEEALPESVNALKQLFTSAPYVSSYEYMSAEEILAQEEQFLGADIDEMLGVNPYQPEFDVKVKAAFASTDSINAIIEPLKSYADVSAVTVRTEMVDEINSNISTMTMILFAVAIALLLVSFVLINNTVRLTIYSRRFLIHTMRLVGATGGFIRKPIVIGNTLNGLLAGVIAIGLLCGLRVYAQRIEQGIEAALPWGDMAPIFVGLLIGGMVICGLASVLATNKYLRQDYDDMF